VTDKVFISPAAGRASAGHGAAARQCAALLVVGLCQRISPPAEDRSLRRSREVRKNGIGRSR